MMLIDYAPEAHRFGVRTITWHINEPFSAPLFLADVPSACYVRFIQVDGHELRWVYLHFPQFCMEGRESDVQIFVGDFARQIVASIPGNERFAYYSEGC